MGEADHPGPPHQGQRSWLPQWAQQWVTPATPATPTTRPWGQKRRKPGLAPAVYQAGGVGWPHQKQPPLGTNKKPYSVSSAQRWYTGPTPTRTPTNVACRVARYDGYHSLTQLPPRSMQTQYKPANTNPNRIQKWAEPCKFGLQCFWKDMFCPFQHPSPMAQAQAGEWAQVKRTVRCWFGNRCTNPFCHFEHSGWIARKVSQGVNTNRRDWDPHRATSNSTKRGKSGNRFDVLQKKRATHTVQQPVAGA